MATQMTANSQRREIDALQQLMVEADVAFLARQPVILAAPNNAKRVTWAPSDAELGELMRAAPHSLAAYRNWIAADAYSMVLFDGAVIQMTYDFDGNDLVGHRLVFFPCPYKIDEGLLDDLPLLDVIELYSDSRDPAVRLVTPMRFDFDPRAAGAGHAASHLSLNGLDCRWPVTAPLSPGHFVRFVFSQFYPHLFTALPFIREWPVNHQSQTITSREEAGLHVSAGRRWFAS
jgi:hypothetical protein